MADEEQTSSSRVKPLGVKRGMLKKSIPGVPFGQMFKGCGNVAHREDPERIKTFPVFSADDFNFQDESEAKTLSELLAHFREEFPHGGLALLANVTVICDNDQEKTVEGLSGSLTVRLTQFKDVDYRNKRSYYSAPRARMVETKSTTHMGSIEAPMGRQVEAYMMAKLIQEGHTFGDGGNKKKWYKELRTKVTRDFWVTLTTEQREEIRTEAKAPTTDVTSAMKTIAAEDRSHSQDYYYRHRKDWAASDQTEIYTPVRKDIFIGFDRAGKLVIAAVSDLFQRLFGSSTQNKVTDAVQKWSKFAPMPRPNTSRHMVDELILQTHPELVLELATTPQELENRPMCVTHYGTWAEKGHRHPKQVFLTPETAYPAGTTMRAVPNYALETWPRFRTGVLGITSEVARFLMRTLALDELERCIEVFGALPEEKRMALSEPSWATLVALGINSFTGRHTDDNDVRHGLATIIALGSYTGADICFPQLGLKLAYEPGTAVTFRGAELEHFTTDWRRREADGFRIFLLYTNHQPVRHWATQRMREAAGAHAQGHAVPGLAIHHDHDDDDDGEKEEEGESGGSEQAYAPCVEEDIEFSDDEEPLTDADIHGAAWWDPERNLPGYQASSRGSGSSGQTEGSSSDVVSRTY